MMTRILEDCKAFLSRQYKESLGKKFADDYGFAMEHCEPFWKLVSLNDLTTSANPDDGVPAGLVLDPEVGALLFFIPFESDANIRPQVNLALTMRSYLSQDITCSLDDKRVDPLGAWHVIIHWLVPVGNEANWMDQIKKLRHETGFSEEITFDLISYQPGKLSDALDNHGLPRLMFACRNIMQKKHADETMAWMSADTKVQEVLRYFDEDFRDIDQKILAKEVTRALESFSPSTNDQSASTKVADPKEISEFHLKDFRNIIRADLTFDNLPQDALVIHGPNGSGKTSIVEAITLSIFQSSERYRRYCDKEERDVETGNRRQNYESNYLTPLNRSGHPEFAFNSKTFEPFSFVDAEHLLERRDQMSGTILTQEDSVKFALATSSDLAARVTGDFSELSDHIQDIVDRLISDAQDQRKDLLREYGLSAQITKIDTAYQQIAEKTLREQAPAFPQVLVSWLESVGNGFDPSYSEIARRWRNWGESTAIEEHAKYAAKNRQDQDRIQQGLLMWLEDFSRLLSQSIRMIEDIRQRITPSVNDLPELRAGAMAWSTWLQNKQDSSPSQPDNVAILRKEMDEKQAKLAGFTKQGKEVTRRIEHLESTILYVESTWGVDNADECPTCGSDVSDKGGIFQVAQDLISHARELRTSLLEQHAATRSEIETLTSELAKAGVDECPVSPVAQNQIREAFSWLIKASAQFEDYIGGTGHVNAVLALYESLARIPEVPKPIDEPTLAKELVEQVLINFRRAEAVFKAPDDWKPVKAKLDEKLKTVVENHLPQTLERLWTELYLSLTAAPWMLPERPRMALRQGKNSKELSIRVKERLSRYILNQAEIHTLGLAWFFTRYLTFGRFQCKFVVLDDAAQEQDQTSFRDFCRLLETLLRLHRATEQKLKLVATLNQETRAVELARATRGMLYVLDWEKEQEGKPKIVDVIGQGYYPPSPLALLEPASTK